MHIRDNKQELDTVPTLVIGLGKTGLSCVRFLRTHGVPVAVTDSREDPPCLAELHSEFVDVEVALGGFDEKLFTWAQRLVVSPGVSVREPLITSARLRGAEVLGDVEIFARLAEAPIVAISGSNGKSTVATLLGKMINDAGKRVLVGGNIGCPVLGFLLEPVPDFYVLELSSFQLETTDSLNAKAAVVLNVSADHMDRYHDIDAYMAAKQRIFSGDGVQLINRDDAVVVAMAGAGRNCISFGLGEPEGKNFGRSLRDKELWLARGSEQLMPVSELRIAGEHNQANALAALALGDVIGLSMDVMLNTLKDFSGLPHRSQWVAQVDGVNWYNDSKGTNVGATVSAIRGLPGPLLLIAGGQAKGADFSGLRDVMVGKLRAVILLGEDAQKIAAVIAGEVPMVFAADMHDAVRQAHAMAKGGDTVLLSPACASFDMFKGFEDRGEVFIEAVKALKQGVKA